MKRTNLILLALAFCLLTSFTTRSQSTGYTANSGNSGSNMASNNGQSSSTGYNSNSGSYTGQNTYEEEEEQYYEEEEQTYNYGGGQTYYEEEEEMGSYTYSGQPYTYGQEYEEEYEEYTQENYNYNSGSYSGGSSYSYGQGNSSSGYGSNQGYTGSYNSNSGSNSGSGSGSSSNTPTFPTSLLTGFVVDIHFLAVDVHFQYIAYHYCSDLFPGFTQCAIYNGTASNSRLVASEQIVTAEIFATLPLAERKLYHSHAYSVKNGLLVIPGLSGDQELQAMSSVITTYGKVVDYWHSYQDFPLGPPRLAYGLAADWQLNNTIINEMDQSLNLGTTWLQRKQQRASIQMPTIIEGANDYLTSGVYPQYVIQEFELNANNSTK